MAIDIEQCAEPPKTEWWLVWIPNKGWIREVSLDRYGIDRKETCVCPTTAQEFDSEAIACIVAKRFDGEVWQFTARKSSRLVENGRLSF